MIFKLDRTNKPVTYIMVVHECHDKRLLLSTGLKIEPSNWLQEKQRVKGRTGKANAMNAKLNFIKSTFDTVFGDFQRQKINPSRDALKSELKIALGKAKPKPKKKKTTLFEFVELFIDERIKANKVSSSSIKKYRILQRRLKEYAVARKKKIDFENVTFGFYNDFIAWLSSHDTINSLNNVGNYIKTLKLIMREAQRRELHNSNHYRDFKSPKEKKSEAVYLSNAELTKILELDLSDNRRLDRVRDWFILGCKTGLRFSDYSQIKKEDIKIINGVTLISKLTQKTTERVEIPLGLIAINILKKYEYELPKPISNQNMNEYIKELCQMAGIEEMITLYTKGRTITAEKYKLVSTHTARRSFATNTYLAGIPILEIMQMTGHRTEKAFLTYIKVTSLDNALKVAQHPYFMRERGLDTNTHLRKAN